MDTLQQYFDKALSRALQDNANQFRVLQTQIHTLTGNVNLLQGNILQVDNHCRRTGERLDAWETQDSNEYQQELEPVIELDGESEYDDERTEATQDPGSTLF